MPGEIADKILEGARQAAEYVTASRAGKPVPRNVTVHRVAMPDQVDVAAIRAKLNMTQGAFADTFGFSTGAVRKWERGERVPEKPIRILLRTIEHNPGAVLAANMQA